MQTGFVGPYILGSVVVIFVAPGDLTSALIAIGATGIVMVAAIFVRLLRRLRKEARLAWWSNQRNADNRPARFERSHATADAESSMRQFAEELSSKFHGELTIDYRGPAGAIDYEIVMQSATAGAARINWLTVAGTFTVQVSPRLEWQSEEWIEFDGDEQRDFERSFEWSCNLISRIVEHGVRFVRVKSAAPRFLRSTQALIGDETLRRPYDTLESWTGW